MFAEGTEKQIAYANNVMQKEINEADKAIAIIAGETAKEDIKPGKETTGELAGIRIVNRWKGVQKYLPSDFGDRLIKRAEEIIEEYKEEYTAMPAWKYLDIRVSGRYLKYKKTIEEALPLTGIIEKRLGVHGDFEEEYKKAAAQRPKKSLLGMLRTEK